jgi:ElaA protein
MEWKCSEFRQLSTHELYSILRARSAVFVVEYAHIHLDLDDKDEAALHIFALEPGFAVPQVVAYARVLPGDEHDSEVVIDKLLTIAKRRDDDTRDLLVAHAVAAVQTVWPDHPIHINVSTHCEDFHEGFGFRKVVGSLEHGTPCVGMVSRHPRAASHGRRKKLAAAPADAPDSAVETPHELHGELGATG